MTSALRILTVPTIQNRGAYITPLFDFSLAESHAIPTDNFGAHDESQLWQPEFLSRRSESHVAVGLPIGSDSPTRFSQIRLYQRFQQILLSNPGQYTRIRESYRQPKLVGANDLWIDRTLPLKPSFKHVVDSVYKAPSKRSLMLMAIRLYLMLIAFTYNQSLCPSASVSDPPPLLSLKLALK
nr:serpin-ZX-like [Ipomoea batatas]